MVEKIARADERADESERADGLLPCKTSDGDRDESPPDFMITSGVTMLTPWSE